METTPVPDRTVPEPRIMAPEREFFIDNLLVRIHFIIVLIIMAPHATTAEGGVPDSPMAVG